MKKLTKFGRLRLWWRRLSCEHSHTFRVDMPEGTPWYSHGTKMGPHPGGLQMIGCYKCGKVWCRDWAA